MINHFTSDFTKMTTNLGDSAVYKLDLKQAASLRSEMSYPIYIIFGFVRLPSFDPSLCSELQSTLTAGRVVRFQ